LVTFWDPLTQMFILLIVTACIGAYAIRQWFLWERAYNLLMKRIREFDTSIKKTEYAPLYHAPLGDKSKVRWSNRWGWIQISE
jgi:hypothetical protein